VSQIALDTHFDQRADDLWGVFVPFCAAERRSLALPSPPGAASVKIQHQAAKTALPWVSQNHRGITARSTFRPQGASKHEVHRPDPNSSCMLELVFKTALANQEPIGPG
jgi:hypothetical protein